MDEVSGKEFNGERIVLDGKSFTKCRFLSCALIFEGTDIFVLTDCSVSNDTLFSLGGPAQTTMQRIHAMLHSTGWAADVAKNLLEILKTPPVFDQEQ
jgi:hypothetical protein